MHTDFSNRMLTYCIILKIVAGQPAPIHNLDMSCMMLQTVELNHPAQFRC